MAKLLTMNVACDSCTHRKRFTVKPLAYTNITKLKSIQGTSQSVFLTWWTSYTTRPVVNWSIYTMKPNLVTSTSWFSKQHYDQLTRTVSCHGWSYRNKMLNCLKFKYKNLTYKLPNPVHSTRWSLWLVLENPCTSKQWQIHTIYQSTYVLLHILDIAFL